MPRSHTLTKGVAMSDIPQQPVTPFDIPPEPALLPTGESHIPPNSYFVSAPVVPQPDATAELMRAPNAEHMAQIQSLYKAHEQELILAWWPHIYLRPSEFVTDKPIVCNVAHVLAHAKGMEKRHGSKTTVGTQDNSYAAAHMQWVAECAARKKWIEAKKADWQKRRKEKADWLASVAVTEAQWDSYVEEARKVFKDAEAYPVPERPTRSQTG